MAADFTRRHPGCGCGIIIFALVTVIGLVGAGLSFIELPSQPAGEPRKPVPTGTPPPAGAKPPMVDLQAAGRPADQFTEWSEPIARETAIPVAALNAYALAAQKLGESKPQCHLTWNTLAGIGWVETLHGTYDGKRVGGARIVPQGRVEPPIRGIQLDGSPGLAHLPDTDDGKWDGDPQYDRAMGPMQFIPDAWRNYGADASGDGRADPDNIDDAALAAGNLLCDHDRDLSTPEGWVGAVQYYNRSREYIERVRDASANYAIDQVPL